MTEYSRVIFQKHHLRMNREIREAAALPPAPPEPLPTRDALLAMVQAGKATHTVDHIHHDEFVVDGITYACGWESPSRRYNVPSPGRWVTYIPAKGPQAETAVEADTPSAPPAAITNAQVAVNELLARFRQEAQGPGPIWAGAAKDIVRALEQKTPEEALAYLAKERKSCGKMTVSCFYAGAANRLRAALRADQKKKKLARLTPAEDKAWTDAFNYALTELHYGQERADRYAWRDVCKQYPRLAAFDGCLA